MKGLGTSPNSHLIQQEFVLSGAIQCVFCTPGMIIATKALLAVNSDEETRKWSDTFDHFRVLIIASKTRRSSLPLPNVS
ncbi:2Fe-2S iron-sulfur cluster-binding protein [Desulfovibrio inopinatus]|uniref:2Fe-2S iron-sulfur cluster-binding protein n=1 Tax=Desulfovibrio inopinatus TaxID=102109 RepID=UPI003CCC2662